MRSRPLSAKTVFIWQTAMNCLYLVLLGLLALSAYLGFASSRSLRAVSFLAINLLFVSLFLARRPATEESSSFVAWMLAMAAMTLPLLMRIREAGGFVQLGTALQIAGLAGVGAGLLSLRRSFAVAPANRGVRQSGMYGIVRHPIYISELVVMLGIVFANPGVVNLVIWLCVCGLQFARALAEEDLLSHDPVYRAYRGRVRYRLIPGLL